MGLLSIKTAYGLAETLYGTNISEGQFEEIALIAWERINRKHSRLHKYTTDVIDGKIILPCNVDRIEAVTININDAQVSDPINDFNWDNILIEDDIEADKVNKSAYYPTGKYVKYQLGNGELYFEKNYNNVTILYHGFLVDEEGLPLVNEKEIQAIAAYVAYASLYKEGLKKRDTGLVQLSQTINADWLRLCNAARIPDYIDQNKMDEILDVKTCWDRKKYGKSYKPIR